RQRLSVEYHPDGTVLEHGYASRATIGLEEISNEQPLNAVRYQSVTDRKGNLTVNAIDARGNLAAHYYDSLNARTLYQYAAFGVLTYMQVTLGNITWQVPDRYGRIVTRVDPDRGTRWNTFTAFDEIASSTDARDVTSEYTYDRLGRLRYLLNTED